MRNSVIGLLKIVFLVCTILTPFEMHGQETTESCLPEVSASFSQDNLAVTANSTKEISNVVLLFNDDTTQKFDDLSGSSQSFSGTGDFANLCITGVWIKSGCNSSDDGPGYGEFVTNAEWTGICGSELEIPDFSSCPDINPGEKLYAATSSTNSGNVIHSVWMVDAFSDGKAKFDFIEGQLTHNDSGAELFGTLNLRTGGGSKNNTTWELYMNYNSTDIVDPKLELGQSENLYETWIYYILNGGESFMYDQNDPSDIITFAHMGNPFQIGLSAGGKDINEQSASGWFTWYRGNDNGRGDVNINIEDLCPPLEGISPVLECVEVLGNGQYLAHFGYNNNNDAEVIIPISGDNKFNPSPIDRGQPFTFLPGRQVNVYQVPFEGANLVWTLASPNGSRRTSTASSNGKLCDPGEEACEEGSINGGSIAFEGSYDPNGTNIINNIALPTSPFAELGFEYIWLQNEEDTPNIVGNTDWEVVEGSEGMTELTISGLTQTMYFIRCARIAGCETYWGETNTVEVVVTPCEPGDITGGEVAFDGPYDPNGTNLIYNVELPSSPYADLGFEYIWMQSLTDVANTPGNPHWSPIEGSQNLTELEVSNLVQTTYFIRCARLVGCDDYWGETPSVVVEIDPCQPEDIAGGEVAFDGPYDPNGTNLIYNVELPSSPYADLGFEYIWMQSLTDVPNTPNNTAWSPVAGSENLTELEVSGLSQTTYFIRCARIIGCDNYWGETPSVVVEIDPCQPEDIAGGEVAFDGPYDPNGTNLIYNVELPSSPYADLGFEYIWMQSLTDVANTPGNPHWSPIEGSQNLTELEVSGLSQTTYFIRCARIIGCDDYWGETPSVVVEIDPCQPEDIAGGEVAFDGPYDPNGTNLIYNVELPSSPYADLGFEYIWMQSLTDVPNTPNNTTWSPVAGSENLTELEVSGLSQTTYFIRCARLVGCDDYWGETPSVAVEIDPCQPADITGGTVAFDGPYDPNGTNLIYNVELPSSPYADLGFEYIWMQSLTDVPNTPNSTAWSPVAGSENLTELEVSGLSQTTYFIRCARLVGCDDYWGETPSVAVEIDPCQPADITGGTVAFDGPYDPNGTNLIYNVELPTSPYAELGFEYIWMQSLTDVPNTPNNTAWSPVAGSENLTELEVSGFSQTTYFIRCARLVGCDDYWGETPSVAVEIDPCQPADITGGTVAFDGPYDPNGTNLIYNVELPTSPYAELGFEYIWMQSLTDVPNTPNNTAWSPVAGSENLTELEVSGLSQTTYFIRCARLVGCDDYWGETPSVVVEIDPCQPEDITGGEIAFNGPYNPEGINIITNVSLPTSPYAALGFEYIWLQNDENEPNIIGNTNWEVIPGSENLTELTLPILTQTKYFIRCARINGCIEYWGESNVVQVDGFAIPTANIAGGGEVCEGETATVTITLTGVAPFTIVYTNGITDTEVEVSDDLYKFEAPAGIYTLVSVDDVNYSATLSGEAVISNFATPTAILSGGGEVCEGATTNVEIALNGTAPFTVEYTNGTTPETIVTDENSITLEVALGNYSLLSLTDANCTGTVSGNAIVTPIETPTAILSGGGHVCGDAVIDLQIAFTGTAPFTFVYSNGTTTEEITTEESVFIIQANVGEYSLISLIDANCTGTVSGNASVTQSEVPTATISGEGTVCANATLPIEILLTGTAPFTVVYTNGFDQETIMTDTNVISFDAEAGEYSLVSVTDATCEGTVSGLVTITRTEIPTATISGTTSICANETAIITINFTGGGPWTFAYTDGTSTVNASSDVNTYTFEASEGLYNLMSVSNQQCDGTVDGEAGVTIIDSPTASIAADGVVCAGELGTVSITFTGTGPWVATYTDGSNEVSITSTETVYTFEAVAGTYSLLNVSDVLCTGTVSGTAVIENFEAPTAFISGGGQLCGKDVATINITLTGNGPWAYSYKQGKNTINATSEEAVVSFTTNQLGTYTLLSVSDANCSGTVSGIAEVTTFVIPEGEINLSPTYCVGEIIELANNISEIGTTFSWSTDGSGFLENSNSKFATYQATEEEQNVTFSLIVNNGCTDTEFTASTNFISTTAAFSVSPAPEDGILLVNVAYEFIPEENIAEDFVWDFGDNTQVESTGGVVEHTYTEPGEYTVTLTVTNETCQSLDALSLTVGDNRNLFIPNVFSPRSANPENSSLKVYGEDISDNNFEFVIYNRWGHEVFRTTSLTEAQANGWSGNSDSEEKENNVFTYIVRGEFNNGEAFEETGAVTLVK